ncbi:hypothetical protein C0989_010638 [Termitomyces sp. Mn162]|nr:hypothetical protein C0989_010638 [Termitomyces sp. Mn162]
MSSFRRSTRLALTAASSSVLDCGVATPLLKRDESMTESHNLSLVTSTYSPSGQNSDIREVKDVDELISSSKVPKRKQRRSNALKLPEEDEDGNKVKHLPGKKKAHRVNNGVEDIGDGEFKTPKSPRKRQRKPEPVYVIPDVEIKTTTFKGRLGYACLNTVLRNKRPANELDSLNKNGIEWVKDLGKRNVEDLLTIIQWNEDNFTQLGSPKPEVVKSSIRELEYHCEMLDRMGIGIDGVMIIHGGGIYGDKVATIERIKKTITEHLPQNVRSRLVLENDELCYNAEDLLSICEELDIPLVFDYHHDTLNPSSISPSAIIQRANAVFARRGIRPKQHLSEPRPGAETLMEKRAHADRCQSFPADLPDDMASLRPPAQNQTKETKGRKSTKRLRAKAEKEQIEAERDTFDGALMDSQDSIRENEIRATRTDLRRSRRTQTRIQKPRDQVEVLVDSELAPTSASESDYEIATKKTEGSFKKRKLSRVENEANSD